MQYFGYLLIGFSFFWFIVKLFMAYETGKGTAGGGTPVLDGIIFPTLFSGMGIFFINSFTDTGLTVPLVASGVFLITTAGLFLAGKTGALFPGKKAPAMPTFQIAPPPDLPEEPVKKTSGPALPLTKKDAGRAVLLAVSEFVMPGTQVAIDKKATMDTLHGWVFFYNSKKFLNTQDHGYSLIGNNPVFIERESGEMHIISLPDETVEEFLERFAKEPKEKDPAP